MARQLSSYFGIMLVICLMAMATGIACSSGTESAGDNAATESQETAVATEAAAAVEKVADEAKEVVSTEAAAAVEKVADEAKEAAVKEAAAVPEPKAQPEPGNIGVWGDTSSRTSWRLVIYEKDGKVFVDQTFPNGKTQLLEVAESEVPAGRKFAALDASQASTYWVLDSQGKLQIYNKEGLITTINPLK